MASNKTQKRHKYISLQEATQFCNYSQEYLSLRARQRKLKAIKIGRNWVTTKEWVREYLKKYNNNNKRNNNLLKRERVINKKSVFQKIETQVSKNSKAFLVPENLPVEKLPAGVSDKSSNFFKAGHKFKWKDFFQVCQPRFALMFALVFVLILAGIFFGKVSLFKAYNDASLLVEQFNKRADSLLADGMRNFVSGVKGIDEIVQRIGKAGDFAVQDTASDFQDIIYSAGLLVDKIGKAGDFAVNDIVGDVKDVKNFYKEVFCCANRLANNTGRIGDIAIKSIALTISSAVKNTASFVNQSFTESIKAVFNDIQNINNKTSAIVKILLWEVSDSFSGLASSFSKFGRSFSVKIYSFNVGLAWISSEEATEYTIWIFKEYGKWVRENVKSQISKVKSGILNLKSQVAESGKTISQGYFAVNDFLEEKFLIFKNWSFEIGEGIVDRCLTVNNFIEKKIIQGRNELTYNIKQIPRFFRELVRVPKKVVEKKLIPESTKQGIVVVPFTERDEEIKKKLKASFSDEIKVEPKDETSGYIIPVFRKREGEKYLYIMVPVRE